MVMRKGTVLVTTTQVMVKIYHDHGNSYKEKTLTWCGLHFRGAVHYQHGATGYCLGRQVAREGTEDPTS